MDWGTVGTAFVLGLTASLSCLGLCIPVLVPYIMEKDDNRVQGLITSILFSLGRLIIYLSIGIALFLIYSELTDTMPATGVKIAVVVLGSVVIIYGLWTYFKPLKPRWCPAKLAEKSRSLFTVVLGALIGSFMCFPIWIMYGLAVEKGDLGTMLGSVLMFWLGSTTTIVIAGSLSGEVGGRWGKKIGREQLRELMGIVLILVGIFYLINALIL